jgi:hypothetical protein
MYSDLRILIALPRQEKIMRRMFSEIASNGANYAVIPICFP